MLTYFLIVIVLAISLSILTVQKGHEWPIKKPRIYLQLLMRKFHWRLPQAMYCTVCASFWFGLIADLMMLAHSILLHFINGTETFTFYFFWPISGFVAAGITWLIFEFLNVLDNVPVININN